jgi:Flp pilus assembly protein TadG
MKRIELRRSRRRFRSRRRGAIAILALILLIAVLAFAAFAVDVGLITTTEAELQNAADAAAIAGARGLLESPGEASSSARRVAERNSSAGDAVEFNTAEDIQFGVWDEVSRQFTPVANGNELEATAVRVTARRTSARNNALPLFFARILGRADADLSATSVAAAINNFRGFTVPSGDTLPILPFTMDLETWESIQDGGGPDNWSFNLETDEVENSWDGISEMNLFPEGNQAPGNRGHLEIGSDGGNVNTLRRQIVHGLGETDLNHHGGALDLGEDGALPLGGEPGVKATLKSEFESIEGELRIIPIFASVAGNGENTQYTIVKWVGVRIMHVKFNGNPKQIMLQPTQISITVGGIPQTENEESSHEIYSAPRLVY